MPLSSPSGHCATCGATAKEVAAIATEDATSTGGVLTVDPTFVKRVASNKIAFQVPSTAYPATVDGQPSTVNPS